MYQCRPELPKWRWFRTRPIWKAVSLPTLCREGPHWPGGRRRAREDKTYSARHSSESSVSRLQGQIRVRTEYYVCTLACLFKFDLPSRFEPFNLLLKWMRIKGDKGHMSPSYVDGLRVSVWEDFKIWQRDASEELPVLFMCRHKILDQIRSMRPK